MGDTDRVDLASWLRLRGAMPADAAVAVVSRLADALDAVHDAGQVHGDVTASAVIVDEVDGSRPVPATIGVSLAPSGATSADADPRSDIVGLGRVLERALSGTAAPDSEGAASALASTDVPAGLNDVVRRAISTDPATGYRRAGDLAAAARAALDAPVSSAEPAGAAGTLVRPIAPVGDPATTLDRPLTPTTDAAGTLDRPLAPTADAAGTLDRPLEPTAGPATTTGTTERTGDGPAPGWTTPSPAAPPPRRRRGALVLGALTVGVVVVAVLAWTALGSSRLEVVGATVVPAGGRNQTCDATVDVVGTVRTNGGAGTITYVWLRSDGSVTAPSSERLDEGPTSVDVHLLWTINGTGRYPASATLRILEPTPSETRTDFVYDCR